MADVVIDRIDPSDTATIAHMNNQVFRPEREPAFFARRLRNRVNPLVMVARIGPDAAGFFIGMELKPTVFFAWLVGVLPDARRMGIASQLMRAAEGWAGEHGYRSIRFECTNRHRAMMHFGIAGGYDLIGLRWDGDRAENLMIFERALAGGPAEE
ncbi:MAG: N-acetyltransferase [Planctomycetota bacterium]|nr:MAG: N-acetyltransferase [Planctomycetota bacterium]